MKQQQGGTFIGFVVGLLVGLAVALAIAVYITKVPIPFLNKGQSRSADQDDAEAQKNKDWDVNALIYGKNPVKPAEPAAKPEEAVSAVDKPEAKREPKLEVKPAVSADPLGDLVRDRSAGVEPFNYFVQVGAFRTAEDAESQRAKLSLAGVEAKVSEREQSGRAVFRVRVGPFDKKEVAEKAKDKLEATGLDTALVRVQR